MLAKINKAIRLITVFLACSLMFILLTGYCSEDKDTSLKTGKNYSGFTLKSIQYISEIESQVFIFNHNKSGARLIFLKNNDNNKVFSIGFKTPAVDNSGVNHIIEHSVLDGSLNYPVKSPLSEMSKRSLNTFLNAYTSPDRTIFPIASRNEKDFNNLMSVYLDAVFYPNVLKDERIFLQEAGHYELKDKKSDLIYKGVVYNEMKGDLSSPDSILRDEINKSLFPDTEYRWNHGGTPEAIPHLTYEQLKETYINYYHPSNSFIYLYGNLDIFKTLKLINDKYLVKFTRSNKEYKTKFQAPFKAQKIVNAVYPVSDAAGSNNKTYLALNFLMDKTTNKDDAIGLMFINYLLLEDNSSIIKNTLLKSGVCSNVYGSINDEGLQTAYSIIGENGDPRRSKEFVKVINNTLKAAVKRGIDKRIISSLMHSWEINIRANRNNVNRGILYNDLVMSTWMHNSSPTLYLTLDDSLNRLKKAVETDYFERFINKYLLENKTSSLIVLKPEPGLSVDKQEEFTRALKGKKEKMTQKQQEKIISQADQLRKWQREPNSEEAVNRMPTLDISDVDRKAEVIPIEIKSVNGTKVLEHKLQTNKIIYSDLYFDTSGVPQDKIQYLNLLSMLLGKLGTESYRSKEIAREINNTMGGISFSHEVIKGFRDSDTYYPKLDVGFYTLDKDTSASFKVIDQIINHTKFNNRKLLKQYINVISSSLNNNILNMGMEVAKGRVESYYSNCGQYGNLGLLDYWEFINNLNKNYDENYNDLTKNLRLVADIVFNKNNVTVSVTGSEEDCIKYEKSVKEFLSKLKKDKVQKQVYTFKCLTKNEGLLSSSGVQYIAQGYDFTKLGYKYSGKLLVLKNILNEEFIWNRIRELGGAYGGAVSISSNGDLKFLSWRDPNVKETLDIFSEAGDFIKKLKLTDRELQNYIISTIGELDRPMDSYEKGRVSDMLYFKGVTQNDIQQERNEILHTSLKDIKDYGDMLRDVTRQNTFCIFGNEKKLKENKEIFSGLINLSKN